MGEIKNFVELYIKESDILEEETDNLAINLQNNIKAQLWKGHGYDQGRLKRAIRVDTRVYDSYSIITGFYDEGLAPHGIYVLRGIRGKGKAKAGPIDFLGDGLQRTVENYR